MSRSDRGALLQELIVTILQDPSSLVLLHRLSRMLQILSRVKSEPSLLVSESCADKTLDFIGND